MPSPSRTPLVQALTSPKAPAEEPEVEVPEGDELTRARATVLLVMDGRGGRNATARLRAAELILGKHLLAGLSDDDLEAEMRRRLAARGPTRPATPGRPAE